MKTKTVLIGMLAYVLMVVACQEEESIEVSKQDEVSAAVIERLQSLYFNTNDISVGFTELPDGSKLEGYNVEGDIFIPYDQLDALEVPEECDEKHYQVYNLVSCPRTLKVVGLVMHGYGLSTNMQEGLEWAINNYNNLFLDLTFELEFSSYYGDADIVIYQIFNPTPGGNAGFPMGGDPYKWVQIYSGTDYIPMNAIEHVITHEIGHVLGLRHNDWQKRYSCNDVIGEDAYPDGAIHIPGTPTGLSYYSLMNACFYIPTADGEFSYYDIEALRYLYD